MNYNFLTSQLYKVSGAFQVTTSTIYEAPATPQAFSINQWFSNLREHQNHLEGSLKHRVLGLTHTDWFSRSWNTPGMARIAIKGKELGLLGTHKTETAGTRHKVHNPLHPPQHPWGFLKEGTLSHLSLICTTESTTPSTWCTEGAQQTPITLSLMPSLRRWNF